MNRTPKFAFQVVLLLVTIFNLCYGQLPDTVQNFRLIKRIPFSQASITTDRLGNAYVITSNQLLKFSADGEPIANFSNSASGQLLSVDAGNPLKVLLFYPDYARVQILNSNLAIESTIELWNIGLQQPSSICYSSQEGFWVFDLQDFSLKKLDLSLRIKYQGSNLLQLLNTGLNPLQMTEYNEQVYLNDPALGLLVFDRFGTYLRKIPVTGIQSFQFFNNELYYLKGNRLLKDNQRTDPQEVILPSSESLLQFRIEQKKIFLLTTTALEFYSY